MGAIIEQLRNKQIQIDKELLGCSHSKLVQYYSSYKSICDSFTINLPQYTHIFGPNKLSFEAWDTKNKAKIDALEMFSGLIVFSNIKYEQKVKFLFQLFDFNEEGRLGYQNIALMLLNIINASFKIFSIKSSIENSTVQTFLDEYFTQDSEVQLERLIRWTLKVHSIGDLFKAIGQEIEYNCQQKRICQLQMLDLESKTKETYYREEPQNILPQAYLQKIKSGFKLSQKEIQSKKIQKLNINLEWVFGINLGKQTIKYVWVQGQKAANQRIVYVSGKLIIIYFPKLNIQQYYKQHQLTISAIQISSNKKLVASGESNSKRIQNSGVGDQYPSIHVWDFETKVLLAKFKKLHKNSIQYLKFIKNDQLLVTSSQNTVQDNTQTPIIIVSLQTKQIITSTYLKYEILGIEVSYSFTETPYKFIALGKNEIATFTEQKSSFKTFVRKMKPKQPKNNQQKPNQIKAKQQKPNQLKPNQPKANQLKLNQMKPNQLKVNQPILCFSVNSKGQIFTCHASRKLVMWEEEKDGGLKSTILKYTSESVKDAKEILCLGNTHLAILDSQDIQILRLTQNEISRIQRLRLQMNLQFRVQLFHMQAINQLDILLISCFGQVYRIKYQENSTSITSQQYQPIFRLIDPVSYFDDHHSNKIFIVCKHLIYAIDRYQKELLILVRFEETIEKITSNKHCIFLLCKTQSKTSILYCLNTTDLNINQTRRFAQKQNDSITDIFATQNHVFAFSQQNLHYFLRHQQKNLEKQQNHLQNLDIQKIRRVIPTKEPHTLLIFNQQNSIFQFPIQGTNKFKHTKVEKIQVEMEEISTYYFQETSNKTQQKYKYPFCANLNRSLILLGKKNGDLVIWESFKQAICNEAISQKLSFLCSPVTEVTLCKDQISTTSLKDQLVIIYKHNHYLPQNEIDSFLQEPQCASSQQIVEVNYQSDFKDTSSLMKQPKYQNRVRNQIGGVFLKQSQMEISSLSESNKSELRQLIRDIINPKDKVSYQPQLQTQNQMNATKICLETSGVLGISTSNPLGVFYTHRYNKQPQSLINRKYWESNNEKHDEQLHFAPSLLLPIDDTHLGCSRQFVYAAGRLCVLRESNNNQKIYEFHRRKVTCIAVHPQGQMMMSCEQGEVHPIIHIWNNQQVACRASITARHNSSITRGSFSKQGHWLVTLGGSQGSQSFQIVNWQDEEIVSFVPIQGEQLWDILLNPYNDRQITVLGTNIIKVYEQVNGRLIIVDESRLEQEFLCGCFTSSVFGNKVESDLITGSRTGDIGIYICGKFIQAKLNAHMGAVVCLRLAELFGYKKVLISGGEEGMLIIWDTKFVELSRKDIKEDIFGFNFNKTIKLQTGITSIDIYQCLKVHETDRPPTLLLIATTDGSVLQAKIKNEFQGYKAKSSGSKQVTELKQKINFDVSVAFNGPPSLPGTKFEIFGQMMITYSRQSPHIQIWNVTTWQRIGLFTLSSNPAIIRFMNNSPIFMTIYNKEPQLFCHIYKLEISNKLIRNIVLLSELFLPKGYHQIVEAIFSEKDNKIAFAIRLALKDEILLYNLKEQKFELNGKIQTVDETGKTEKANYRCVVLQFSSEGEGLLVGWADCTLQLLSQSFLEKQYIFRCYYVETKQQVPMSHFDFKRIDFSRRIKLNYLLCNHLGKSENQKSSKTALSITAMAHYDCFLLLGTANGEVIVVQAEFFLKKQKDVKKQLRYFVVEDSPITILYVIDSVLFVGSLQGECVVKFDLKSELGWGMNMIKNDTYNQNMSQEWVTNKMNVYEKRKKIQNEDYNEGDNKCDVTLSLAAILGRNAEFKRNSIFVNFKDEIIYFSGCNIIIMKNAPNQKIEQTIVKPDPSPNTIYPQISAMALGDCKSKLVVGTAEEQAKLLVWNISTKTFLCQIPLGGYCLVTAIKLSSSGKHAAVIAVMPNAVKHLLFINLDVCKVLAVSKLPSPQLNINDLCFVQNNQFKILGCGQNLMGEWQYKTGLLIHKRYSLDSSQDLSQIKASGIIFYSLIYMKEMIVTSGSDGYLYVWKDGRLAKRHNAHPKAAVLSLYTAPNSRVFASGGTDGRVVIWKVWPGLIIQQQKLYPKEGNLALGIQSVSMTLQELVVGDISGSIWTYPFGNQEVKAFQPLMSSFNNETINSCAFSTASKKLFVATSSQKNMVVFTVFDTNTYLKIKEEKLDLKSPLIKMIACKLSNIIIFVLQTAILGFSLQGEDKQGKEEKGKQFKSKQQKGKQLRQRFKETKGKEEKGKLLKSEFNFKWQHGIKNAVLSGDENYLAVLMNKQNNFNCVIDIFCLRQEYDKFFKNFEFLEQQKPSANSNTNMIDFCTGNDYLIYQAPDQDATIFNLARKKNIKLSQIENQLQWNDEAKRNTPSIAETIANYSQEYNILKLVQTKNKCLIATDETGSVRVFNYPKTEKGGASKVYIQHLNEVYICIISRDQRILVTVSKLDKAIHIWQINSLFESDEK